MWYLLPEPHAPAEGKARSTTFPRGNINILKKGLDTKCELNNLATRDG